jgi:hypothetical protein
MYCSDHAVISFSECCKFHCDVSSQKKIYRRSINRGHRPIRAELESMVITEGLFMEIVSIAIQHTLNPFYSEAKDESQFRPLNFTQKFLDGSEKILWPGNFSYQAIPANDSR